MNHTELKLLFLFSADFIEHVWVDFHVMYHIVFTHHYNHVPFPCSTVLPKLAMVFISRNTGQGKEADVIQAKK
jgi:hypothetical protein